MGYIEDYLERCNLYGSTSKDIYTTLSRDSFEEYLNSSPNSEEISVNKSTILTQVVIQNNDEKTNSKLVLCRYEDNVNIGDNFRWKNKDWMITEKSVKSIENCNRFIAKPCNNTLNWLDVNGNIIKEPCIISNVSGEGFYLNSDVIIAESIISVTIQNNLNTKSIKWNDRFILNQQAFKVSAINNFMLADSSDKNSAPLIYLTLSKDNIDIATDDLVNNIANLPNRDYKLHIVQSTFTQLIGYTTQLTTEVTLFNSIISVPLEWESSDVSIGTIDQLGNITLLSNGVVEFKCSMKDNSSIFDTILVTVSNTSATVKQNLITPNITEILQWSSQDDTTQTYEVYSYIDNVKQSDTFNIIANNVPASYYELNIVDGNTFKIKNKKLYNNNKLNIQCINNADGSVVYIDIKLKGLY